MKWEYVTVKVSTVSAWGNLHLDEEHLHKTLNYYGWEGWELVSSSELSGPPGMTREIALFFKRPVTESEKPPAK